MIVEIIHQIFWTLLSFFLFYYIIKKYLITKFTLIQSSRLQRIEELKNQISKFCKKTEDAELIIHNILKEEIPNNQKFYVEKKLEPIINNYKIEVLTEINILKNKIEKEKKNRNVCTNNELNILLEQCSKKFIEKINKQNPQSTEEKINAKQ